MSIPVKTIVRIAIQIILWCVILHKQKEGPTWEYIVSVILVIGLQFVEMIP